MTILSTNCFCSKCVKKYDCLRYKRVVKMQGLTKEFVCQGDENTRVTIRFQVENCVDREIEKEPKHV